MTFTHVADAMEDEEWNAEDLDEVWEEEEPFETEDDLDDQRMEEEEEK